MSKAEHIQRITSYLGDGFVQFPAGTPKTLEYNGVTISEFMTWIELIKSSLEAINKAGKLTLIPEGVLNSIVGNIEPIRAYVSQFDGDLSDVNNHFINALSHSEQVISQVAPYLNLVDSQNYKNLNDKTEDTLKHAVDNIAEKKKTFENITRNIKRLEEKSENVLRGVSSGVLSDNFKKQSNNWWNWALLFIATTITIIAFKELLDRTDKLTDELILAMQAGKVDYKVFFAKWSLNVPYLFLLSVALLELRSRIKLRDIYLFRQGVAGSLDGYTENLLNKAEDIKDTKERSVARRVVIEFMINSMLELTKSPSVKLEKQKVGFKIKDVAEADITNG